MEGSQWEQAGVEIISDSEGDPCENVGEHEDGESGEADRGNRPPAKGPTTHINSRGSVRRVYRILQSLSEEKKRLVRDIGFGGLLEMPLWNRVNRNFALWVLNKIDGRASSIMFGQRRELDIYDRDIKMVLGIPACGQEVCTEGQPVPDYIIDQVRDLLDVSGKDSVVAAIEVILLKSHEREMTHNEKNKFKVAFVMFAVTYILAPKRKHGWVCNDYWAALANPDMISAYNWAGYILSELLVSAERIRSELAGGDDVAHLSGCVPFAIVFNLDNLDAGKLNRPHNIFPRIKAYPHNLISELISADKLTKRGAEKRVYGKLMPREARLVCYMRNPINRAHLDVGSAPAHNTQRHGSPRRISTDNIRRSVLDHVSSYENRCEDIIIKLGCKIEEENRRHLKETCDLVQESRDMVHGETRVMNQRVSDRFACVARNEKESGSKKRTRPESSYAGSMSALAGNDENHDHDGEDGPNNVAPKRTPAKRSVRKWHISKNLKPGGVHSSKTPQPNGDDQASEWGALDDLIDHAESGLAIVQSVAPKPPSVESSGQVRSEKFAPDDEPLEVQCAQHQPDPMHEDDDPFDLG
ncbi:hypothetical protein ACQ4PT_059818 [Festuca glaucescens]